MRTVPDSRTVQGSVLTPIAALPQAKDAGSTRCPRRPAHLESNKLPVKLDLDALKPPAHILRSGLTLELDQAGCQTSQEGGGSGAHTLHWRRLAVMRFAGHMVAVQASAPCGKSSHDVATLRSAVVNQICDTRSGLDVRFRPGYADLSGGHRGVQPHKLRCDIVPL